jgi:dipeptidyl aminopeptidase/acylaminoacyl peptidase
VSGQADLWSRSLFRIGLASAFLWQAPPGAANAVTISDLVELTDIDGLSVSPDGRFAVFRTERADVGRNAYVLRWHSVDLGSGQVRNIGSGGEAIYADPGLLQPEKPLWASDGRTIVVRALNDGVVGLWRVDVEGDGMNPLVNGDADVLDYMMTADRSGVLYETGATRDEIRRAELNEYDSGILVDSTVDLSQNLFRGGSINGRMSSQRLVGYWYVRAGLLWRTPHQQRRIDLQSGTDVPVEKPKAVPPFTLPSLPPPVSSADANGNAVASDWGSGKGVVSATLADGRKIVCRNPFCASQWVASFVWLTPSREVLVTFSDVEHRQSLYLWNVAANRLRKLARSDGLLSGDRNGSTACAASASGALCVAASAASPPRLEWIDFATGRRRVVFDPNAVLRPAYHPRVRYLHWAIGGGKQAGGVLMLPEGGTSSPAPLYLNYYRCDGFLRGGVGDEWPVPQLLEAGYAVACINSVPFTGPQDGVGNYQTGLGAVRPLIDSLARDRIIDPTKVAMGGLSFGSEVAFWIALHSNLLAALSVSSLQLEPAGYWMSAMPGSDIPATMLRVWGLGDPDKTAARWNQVAPALNAAKIRIPVLFQLPENEARRIPELYARLSGQGTPTELYAYPDEAHLKLQPRHRLAVYQRNLDWFRYWLEDYRDPDREKADQYRRWDQLRSRWKGPPAPIATTAPTAPARPSR